MRIREIAQTYYGGTVDGIPCGEVTPNYTGYAFDYADWPQELKDEYSYNPEKAKQLLAEAAADGAFEVNKYGGFDTNIVLSSSRNDIDLMQVIKAEFLDIGVDMEIEVMEHPAWEAFTTAGKHDQMAGGLAASASPPHVGITAFDSRDPRNLHFTNDPAYDALVDSFNAASDVAEAKQIIRETDRYAIEKHWMIVVCPTAKYNVWQPYLKGYCGEAIAWGQAHTWARLWIDQDLK